MAGRKKMEVLQAQCCSKICEYRLQLALDGTGMEKTLVCSDLLGSGLCSPFLGSQIAPMVWLEKIRYAHHW